MQIVDQQLHDTWKHTRGDWKNHWIYEGGYDAPERARSKPPMTIRSQADWDELCAYWVLERSRVSR